MKTISIPYNYEKLAALKHFMEMKDMNLVDELVKYADSLFAKYVPTNVREYIDLRNAQKNPGKPKAPTPPPDEGTDRGG